MRRRTRALLACAAAALAGLAVAADRREPGSPDPGNQDALTEYEATRQRHLHPDPDIPVPEDAGPAEPSADPAPADSGPPPWQAREDALWRLLEARQLDALDAGLAALAADYPDWKPPPRLLSLARSARERATVAAADTPEALVEAAGRYPGRFTCAEAGNLWALADARRSLGEGERAIEVLESALERCRDPALRRTALAKLRPLLSPEAMLARVEAEAALRPDPRLDRLRLELAREAATRAAGHGDCGSALDLLARVEDIALAARDEDVARLAAGCHRRLGEPEAALPWQERLLAWSGGDAGAAVELAGALAEAGRREEALALARKHSQDSAAAARLARDLLAARAAAAMEAGDCGRALADIEEAAGLGNLERDERLLRAWTLHDCGRMDEAADAFAGLYREGADAEAARGLVLTDYARRRLDHALGVAEAVGGPLAGLLPAELPRRGGEVDHGRLTLSDGRVAVVTVREHAALAGVGYSSRRGDGPSRLDAWRAPALAAEYRRDRHRLELEAVRLDLESGAFGLADFPLAPGTVTDAFITEQVDEAWAPRLAWRYDGGLGWDAELGATPSNGPVGATWTGRAAVRDKGPETGWELALVRAPVRQSVLSWTGVEGAAEAGGQRIELPFDWGRVTRNGLEADGYARAGGWQVSGSLRLGSYRGENVPDNAGGEFYGLAERPLGEAGRGTLYAGPYLYLSAFEDNLGRFSPGHGGYFSPAWLWGTGLAGRWRADVADGWVELRGSLGYQRHREDAADAVPDAGLRTELSALLGLAPSDFGRFASVEESGAAGSLELEAVRRIGASRWHWGGYLRGRFSPEFDDTAAMLVLRWGTAGERPGLERQFRGRFGLLD